MKDNTSCKPLMRSILLSCMLLFSSFTILPSAMAQTADSADYVISMNLLPSKVELGNAGNSKGYVGLFSNAEGSPPAIAPRDLEIELNSSNSTIASVPTPLVIPAGKQYTLFDILTGGIEGSAEISAVFGNQIVTKNFIISQAQSQIPPNVKLAINLPSDKMQVGSEMPVSIYLEHEGGVVQAPEDITVSLNYQRDLVSLSSNKVTIAKGNFYAIVNVRTLEKSGFALIEASTVDPPLDTVKVIEIASTQPASLKTYVFPDKIGPSEKTIDVFVALLDASGNPTIAPANIDLDLFSNSGGVTGIREVNAVIKKGEYGFYYRQSVSFFPKQAAVNVKSSGLVNVVIGASSQGLGSSSASFTVMPADLSSDNLKATEKIVRVFTIDKMPSDANSIVVYQIAAVARDLRDADYNHDDVINNADTTAATTADVPISDRDMNRDGVVNDQDFHAIDNLADGEFYPIRANVLYSTSQANLDVVTSNIEALRVVDSGFIGADSSYGAALMSSERLGANLGVSISIQSIGSGTGPVTVVGGLNPTQTKIVSPIGIVAQDGSYGISFNGDGYSDLIILSLDSQGRPARSPNGINYLIEPINQIAEIEPGKSFTIVPLYASSFGDTLGETSVISVTPIGVNADSSLKAESSFNLVPSTGTVAKVTFPFDAIIGSSSSHSIGIVQLVDSTGNQVLASNDLEVRLSSSDPEVVRVPTKVVIPNGKSFVQFSITTFGKSGDISISASTDGAGSSTARISSALSELEGSFVDKSGLRATIPEDITISTPLEGTNVRWGPPAAFELLARDDKALIYDSETNSYLANMQVVAHRDGNFTISATLSKDGFQTTTISKAIVFEPYLAQMIVSIDYQQPTISYNTPTTINVLVEDESGQPVKDALIEVTPGKNATAVPEFLRTEEDGTASFVYTSTGPNPKVSLELVASKDGYIDGLTSKEFEVIDVPTALPSWVTYAAIAGVVASIGGGVVYFMKKPKGKRFDEETEEEDEEI